MLDSSSRLIGKVLGGKYTLVERIGEGGYAVVFRSWQAHLSRYVAVKVLLPRVVMDASTYHDFLVRFKREAGIIAQFDHDHIVPVFDYGEQDGQAYLVMPYLAGGSLHDILTKRGKLSLPEALSYVEQAASALDYAHKRDVIHRDLKPSNFLLSEDGRLVLADFGIARILQSHGSISPSMLTKADMFLGTPAYMAPEMIQPPPFEPVDHRADIYELGIVLFQMLSGDVPFKGNDYWTILLNHIKDPLPVLSRLDPTIPPSVDAVLQKATAKSREKRYASAGEFAQALRDAITLSHPIRPAQAISPFETPTYLPSYIPPQLSYSATSAGRPTIAGTEVPPLPQTVYAPQPPWRKRLGTAGLALILCVILVAIGGVWFGRSFVPTVGLTPTPGVSRSVPLQEVSTLVPTRAVSSCQDMYPLQASTSATLTPQLAQNAVQQYYCYWNKGDYQDAYSLLGSNYRKQYTLESLGYASTKHSEITPGDVVPTSNGMFNVYLTDNASEDSGQHRYTGYFIVGMENGTPSLLCPQMIPGQGCPDPLI